MADDVEVRGGTVDEGLANGRLLLKRHPQSALLQARTLLKAGPDPRVLRLAAAAHRKLGEPAEAEAAELAAIQHSLAIPALREAAEAEHDGNSGHASALAAALLRAEPDDLLAMAISAEAAISLRRLTESEALLSRVLERAPGFLRASMFLARCLMLQSRIREAVDVMGSAAGRVPASVPAGKFLAQLQAEARDFEGAAATYERLLGLDGPEAELWVSYGDMLRFLGRAGDSAIAYRRAILADRSGGAAWWALSNLDAKGLKQSDIERMEAALRERAGRPEDAGALHFALGEAFDARGCHEQAYGHFAEGNRLRASAQPYDPSVLTGEVDRSIELFTTAFLGARSPAPKDGSCPVFIVGMPRSGSTLVERILASHAAIEGAGELPVIPRMVEVLSARGGGTGGYRGVIDRLGARGLRSLGDEYLARAGEYRRTAKPYFTDKLHMNWRHVGFIRLILPEARFIDVRRGALDCCWSNFKLLFTRGHPAASDLAHIGRFYADYVRMMDHMEEVAPDAILRVGYEDLVGDIEQQTRRMLDFIGLPFDKGCLEFAKLADPVATASSEQVRRPINRDGVGSSKPYEQWLGPLRDALRLPERS